MLISESRLMSISSATVALLPLKTCVIPSVFLSNVLVVECPAFEAILAVLVTLSSES